MLTFARIWSIRIPDRHKSKIIKESPVWAGDERKDSMTIQPYPDKAMVDAALAADDPLLVMILFDGTEMLLAPMDEALEHHILLAKAGKDSSDIDRYFRLVVDSEGADWTFVCPPDYKGIPDKSRRIRAFYRDGFNIIPNALQEIGLLIGINIPRRYQRHFRELDGE